MVNIVLRYSIVMEIPISYHIAKLLKVPIHKAI